MGQEITTDVFSAENFDRFRQHLHSEMELLRSWFAGDKFCDDELQCGLELEGWLIGQDGNPVPDNSLFLATLDRKWVVPELSKFNFEVNVSPQYLKGCGLRDMHSEFSATWSRCREVASRLDHDIVSVGILPTVTNDMLCIENMSTLQRYAALNQQVLRLRGGSPLTLHIEGQDRLHSVHQDLMLESAATSVQVHLKVPPRLAVRYYNASVIASCFTVAMAANAPLLFGQRLWADTRITVFEQAVDTAGPQPRVSFGQRYVVDSLLELFESNLADHRVLLPAELDEPPATMPYVRMHNGTLWNWNRPLIGFEADGRPHLRIEHRPMSASPSIADLFSDVAFYLGLVLYLGNRDPAPESCLPFDVARKNFYAAAQSGMQAQVRWLDGRDYGLADLLEDHILECSFDALAAAGVREREVRSAHSIVRQRLDTRQNGAVWQLRKWSDYDGDLQRLLQHYQANQLADQPIHSWQ